MKININNYEEWMIDYIEGNLSKDQRKQLAEFLEFHPELKADLELFEHTKLQTDNNIVFANKALLKKKENGRIIPIGQWVKYSSAVAAVLMLFIGVRYFNQKSDTPVAIKKYEFQTEDSQFVFDRNADSIEENIEQKDIDLNKSNKFFADDHKEIKPEEIELPELKMQLQREDLNTIIEIEYTQVEKIDSDSNKNPSIILLEEQVPEYDLAIVNKTDSERAHISLNDNTNVIDWWNDAVAIGVGMENIVTGILEYDFDPFAKKTGSEETLKTRSLNILGLNYYSRKKSNN